MDLLDKQLKLENEVTMRKESEGNIKKLFDDLSLSYKNLEQFSYVVSHNMRAPLANIKGFVSLYEKSRPGTEQNSQIVSYVETAANHLDEILSDLNYILKNRERALENKEELDFKKMANEICRSLSKEISTTEAKVKIQSLGSVYIFTIKSALTNILYNLIQNAIKYRRNFEIPKIDIEFDASDPVFYYIKVRDNGIGIDLSKYKDRVFKLYSRLNNTVDGKGIGLYLVKTQVEVLGGTIDIESELNKGTTFTIRLPK
jgi:signal transduction histidine kinase